MLAGHGLERMRLVEDRHVVLGKHPKARSPQGQVGDEEGMVDDQEVGRPDPPPGLEVEALLVPRAVAAQAVAVLALDRVPDARQRPEIQVGPGAVGRPVGPELDLAELVELLLLLKGPRGSSPRDIKPAQADVVGPPLDQDGRELLGHHGSQERDVLAKQLLLQRDRVRGDDDLLLLLDGGQDRGHEVGKALAHAGAGLDDEMPRALDGPGHGLGHLELLVAEFVRGQPASHGAAGSKNRSGVQLRHAVVAHREGGITCRPASVSTHHALRGAGGRGVELSGNASGTRG